MKWHRQSLRLENYDYSKCGAYFVTLCVQNRECLFGDIKNGEMRLNELGKIVYHEWLTTAKLRTYVNLDQFIVMPNHFHAILCLHTNGRGTARRAPTMERFGNPTIGSVPTIMRSFKSAVTKHINQLRNTPQQPIWQRNYYEHIIRNEIDLNQIRKYINDNPLKWILDEYYLTPSK